ncbi:mating-type switching protein swi10 [Beauveria brongniartii RCEF 3172]|uniref:Mating-type switching protein swi10 n=1 Tax=Beauveria brongniartii RCEF 3172 TaxID=1081107 RepID=A0A167BLF9_9HYPO|nr:mating-type switching protein swi10 [Beauveria brongniartii RCEF 3172]
MSQRQRLSLYIPGSPPGALPEETTYTPSSDRRRSLISLTTDSLGLGNLTSRSRNNLDSLKPSRAKLQKYWPGAKSPTAAHGTASKDYTTTGHDLSTLILLAGEQMGALGDPRRKTASLGRRPVARQMVDDPKLRRDLEMTLPKSATALSRPRSSASIQRKPLPKDAVLQCCAAAAPVVPAPSRAPPPPPIPELSAVNHYRSEDGEMAAEQSFATPPVMRATPVFPPPTVRRRAKTPVHHIGQLEAAQRNRNKPPYRNGNMDGVNRMSSVSTIAREYRELAVYPETNVPDVPKIDPLYLMNPDIVELPDAQDKDCQDGRLLSASHQNHRRSSSSVSEDGTLLGSEPDTTSLGSCPSLTPSSSSPPASETSDEGSEPPALASLRFQIGIELLTKELSTAFAANHQSSSSRRQKDVGGLQIWVMIEAYERLREQLDAKPAEEENKQARDAIDAWIRALYAIHGNIASDGAADESEYES